jgi:hypothetical protein
VCVFVFVFVCVCLCLCLCLCMYPATSLCAVWDIVCSRQCTRCSTHTHTHAPTHTSFVRWSVAELPFLCTPAVAGPGYRLEALPLAGGSTSAVATSPPIPGDVDIYVSLDSSQPTRCTFSVCDNSVDSPKVVVQPLAEHSAGPVNVYFGVVGYSPGETQFTLTVTAAAEDDPTRGGEAVGSSSGAGLVGDAVVVPDGSSQCKYCKAVVANASLVMHEARCQRINWRCDSCGKVRSRTCVPLLPVCCLSSLLKPDVHWVCYLPVGSLESQQVRESSSFVCVCVCVRVLTSPSDHATHAKGQSRAL